jgi:hypothetical protein
MISFAQQYAVELKNLKTFIDIKDLPNPLSLSKYEDFIPVEIDLQELYSSTTKRM